MASDPVYFVVERYQGRLSGVLYYDRLPDKYTGKRARELGLHYVKRIDDRPHLAALSRQELFDAWELLAGLPDHKEEERPHDDEPKAGAGAPAGDEDRALIEGISA